ncbi:hypothetical protein PCANC_21853 [Puccinia coronata f. sp. avenae]|uniref:Uncharacterized protein n=1 Tax=Puccinia coronata f. sp. avenae TaxID=200324 RepID=A0A2N5U4N0_9BASI|nr:hypothetical protein PCANC_21853 [Puccinia coronata f. sp. avenae]PLW32697.1 hypothetical protein PCASD_16831 [Puccinia coronata f. sp. avenae]
MMNVDSRPVSVLHHNGAVGHLPSQMGRQPLLSVTDEQLSLIPVLSFSGSSLRRRVGAMSDCTRDVYYPEC